jgi:hypothetical protein
MPLSRTILSALWLHALLVSASSADVTSVLGRFSSPPMPGTPAFRLMRADDPWPTNLSNQWLATNTNGLPELLPLHWGDPDRLAFELGGEARWRWERFDNDVWGAIPDDEDGAWLSRYMLHGDLRLGPHFRAFGQLKSHFVRDKQAPIRAVDDNRLDVHQAFGEFASAWGQDSAWRVRAGRQELHYGSGRLLTLREGPNVRLSFDAATVRFARPGVSLDLLAGTPVESDAGTFDDDWLRTERSIWGAYATMQLTGTGPQIGTALDVYYLGVRNENAAFFEGVGLELRHTLGARLFGRQGVWDWNIEVIGQFGQFTGNATGREGDLLAGAFSFDAGATFHLPWRTRIGLKSDFISGDKDSGDGDLETFNPLYPRGSYFGDIGLIGPANLLVLMPTWRTHFSSSVFLDLHGAAFWRQSIADGIYGGGGNRVRGPGGSDERFIGNQINALLGWTISRNLYLELNYAHFFAGDFLAETGPSEDVDYAAVTMAIRF